VRKREPGGVEELALEPELARAAVDRVSCDGEADLGEMDADQVRPAGLEPHAQERVPRQLLGDLEVGHRVPRGRGVERVPRPVSPVAPDRCLDPSGARARPPDDERQVLPLELVRGRPQSRAGRIEAPIGRDRGEPTRQSLDTDTPREAITHFEVVELLPQHALLRIRLETGRTHQIRVHLAAVDLPVAGDRVYGVRDLDLDRQFLHAARLAFPHPITGEPVETESPLPADLVAALDRARSA
jgi:23S rRNA pseudouridine1911/1915/1917 synthase